MNTYEERVSSVCVVSNNACDVRCIHIYIFFCSHVDATAAHADAAAPVTINMLVHFPCMCGSI